MKPFAYQRASSEADAISAAAVGARYLAGGTTLVDLMREEVETPESIVDINRLPLDYIRAENDELVIGALARMSDVAANEDVRRLQPLVAETLIEGASPQLRNVASIGGNLLQRVRCPYFRMLDAPCNKRAPGSGCSAIDGLNAGTAIFGTSTHCIATHPSDMAVSLVALDATLHVRGPNGDRSFPVAELFRLPGDTPHLEHTLRPGELIVEVRIPNIPYARSARYLKVRDRQSYEFALVSAAAALQIENGRVTEARIAAGGVGTRPWRMTAVEQALVGKPATRQTFESAAAISAEGAQAQSGNAFKVKLLPATITRALEMVGESA
ncbi:xanthine dehydrogenase family protein subunit M [Agrobacterium sp. B1(2019)]|uniref:FAD binding domain-containing protein n=1 Tax=Agrobacterium sp. B1(2019) TaxID=2607032 RepID=UPI0011EFF9A5|nr:xanthine dehydrogenase family protein subunit M [Agrobacterium sp. B1(2019)]TZG34260.1 xanthine dehydrogenase family protein subunit M [Agrobacterium sp. B1(2019)]